MSDNKKNKKEIMTEETNITAESEFSSNMIGVDDGGDTTKKTIISVDVEKGAYSVVDGNSSSGSDDDNDGGDKGSTELSNNDDGEHSKYIWLHAFYHSIVTIIGTGILGFPYAMSYLGWAGASITITVISAYCYYTAILLIDLQETGQGTYSEVTDAIMGKGFSNYTVRPAQYLNFFPTTAVMILVGGQALAKIDGLDGTQNLSTLWWMVSDACLVMILSLLPDLNRAWQVSVVGAFAAFLIVGYSIGGSIVALVGNNDEPVLYQHPASITEQPMYDFTLMSSFGSIMFGYGFHSVLPDIHASLHDHNTKDSKTDMKKAVSAAFCFSYPAYLIVALVGFAAFGYQVDSELLVSINNVLKPQAMYVIWIFVTLKTAAEAAVYNQAAFTLTRDICGLTLDSDHVDHHPRNWKLDFAMRFIWVILATCVAVFIPFFNDLTAITAAISITPTTCLLPIIIWNKKHAATATPWRLYIHYVCLFLSVVMALVALIGASTEIAINFENGTI